MNTPADLKFAKSHEWARHEGGVVTVGISDHAQAELTDIVYLELPQVGRQVNAGEDIAVVESVKSASDIYSPVAGEVIEVNEALADDPSGINTDPYGAGWLFKIQVDDPGPLAALMESGDYDAFVA